MDNSIVKIPSMETETSPKECKLEELRKEQNKEVLPQAKTTLASSMTAATLELAAAQ
jgi:hypothetical protein